MHLGSLWIILPPGTPQYIDSVSSKGYEVSIRIRRELLPHLHFEGFNRLIGFSKKCSSTSATSEETTSICRKKLSKTVLADAHSHLSNNPALIFLLKKWNWTVEEVLARVEKNSDLEYLISNKIETEIVEYVQRALLEGGRASSTERGNGDAGADDRQHSTIVKLLPSMSNRLRPTATGVLNLLVEKNVGEKTLDIGTVALLFDVLETAKGDLDYLISDYAAHMHHGLGSAFE